MSVFIGDKTKRVELAERKDAINPNILLNSKDFSANWTITNAAVTSDSYNGGKVVSVHTDGNGSNGLAVSQDIQTPTSQTLTWSVYAKADNAGDKLHTEVYGGGGMTDQAVTTDWCRYTFNGKLSTSKYVLYFWGVSGNKGDIHIALPKLEIGNTATPWCPAYDDYVSNSNFNSKVNVDGPLYKDLTQLNNWSDLFDGYSTSGTITTNGSRLVAFRDDTNGGNTVGNNGAGIAFGGENTKGVLSVEYEGHHARIAGGNGTAPTWNEDIAWKSDITNLMSMQQTLQTTVSSNQTDIATIKNTLKDSALFKPITQADYDALSDDEKANGMYAIGDSN